LLCAHLREYESLQCSQESYQEAKRAREAIAIVKATIHTQTLPVAKVAALVTTDRQAEFEQKWNDAAAKFDEETKERREMILKRQSQNLERFEGRWNSEMPPRYRKPSHQLLELKHTEQNLAMAGEYDRAADVHVEVDAVAQLEASAAQKKLVHDYRNARQKLVNRQAQELVAFEKARFDARALIRARLSDEMARFVNRDAFLKQRKTETTRPKISLDNPVITVPKVSRIGVLSRVALLPPLKPPSDPSIAAEEEAKKRAAVKQRQDLLRRLEDQHEARMEAVQKYCAERKGEKPPTFVTAVEKVDNPAPAPG
jgi:hypothetical protein